MKRLKRQVGIGPARLMRAALSLLLAAGLALAGCKRDADGQLPEVSGEKIVAKREAVEGFGLVAAYPDKRGDDLAIALEFSRRTAEPSMIIATPDGIDRDLFRLIQAGEERLFCYFEQEWIAVRHSMEQCVECQVFSHRL